MTKRKHIEMPKITHLLVDELQDIADVDVMFFLTADSFLCPSCQDKCCTGEIDSRGFPNGDKIWEFVANREVA